MNHIAVDFGMVNKVWKVKLQTVEIYDNEYSCRNQGFNVILGRHLSID